MDQNTDELDAAKKQRDRKHASGDVSHEFADIAEFKAHALSPAWDVSQTRIHVGGIPYRLMSTQNVDWIKVLNRQAPLAVVYRQAGVAWTAEGEKVGLAQWLVIAWRKFNGSMYKPSAAFTTKPHVFTNRIKQITPGREVTESTENRIGSSAVVKITSLPNSGEIKARVDTGATISSLHCDRFTVTGDSVSFVNRDLSPNVITLPLVTHQATKSSDGGTENRPVISLNVRVNGALMQGVQFNLNNRSHMEYPMLLGQNILQQGKFLIDPSMVAEGNDDGEMEVNWESLLETINSELTLIGESAADDVVPIDQYDAMMNSINLLHQKLDDSITSAKSD